MKKITYWDRVRYAFDNTMSRGTIALILWLGVLSVIIIFLSSMAEIFFGIAPDGGDKENTKSVYEAMWVSLMHAIDPGTVTADKGWAFRILMLMVTLGGIFIVSTLIGVLSNGIQTKLQELRKGRSFVIEENHTLIIGYNSKMFTIIQELILANLSQKKPRIVILCDRDKVELEDEIKDKVQDTRNTMIICRSGKSYDLTDLEIANPFTSKSIIILANEAVDNPDVQTIKTIVALVNNPGRRPAPYHITAEVVHPKNVEIVEMVAGDEVEIILSDDFINKIMVQTCRQSGLSTVYSELMSFDGDEIYTKEEPALFGKNFGYLLHAYEQSSVIGIEKKDGKVLLNPDIKTLYEPGDKVIAITEDDHTLLISGQPIPPQKSNIVKPKSTKKKPEQILILGWNNQASSVIKQLDSYVSKGTLLKVVADVALNPALIDSIAAVLTNSTISFERGDTTDRLVLEQLDLKAFQNIMILAYKHTDTPQDADAKTIITLLSLRKLAQNHQSDISIVTEMLDIRNRELLEASKADDFIVSDKLISLLMGQVAENKTLMRVFEELFNPTGVELYLKPAGTFVKTNTPIDFYTVLEATKQAGEIAIGYRIAAKAQSKKDAFGVVINPHKAGSLTFHEEDKIIVLANS
ncbi:MAG TPA: potassium transporter TrkA [Microscillaceae bacterium]|nr:potassium transporter TrkA [Microscillaceae bacterium]